MNPLFKIMARPVIRAFDALLEKLQTQIRNGEKEQAIQTVNEIREAVKSAAKYAE